MISKNGGSYEWKCAGMTISKALEDLLSETL
jgi:hypothetical protein